MPRGKKFASKNKAVQFFQDSDNSDDEQALDLEGDMEIEDDEEIDEDAAFTAEDYLKYGDIGGSSTGKRKRMKEEFSSDEEGEFTSITDLLNGKDDSDLSEEEIDPRKHKKLLNSLPGIDSGEPPRKRFKKLQSELYEESEYNVRPNIGQVQLEDLMPSLEDSKSYGDLKKKLEKLSDKQSSVDKPLSVPVKDRISRQAAYLKAKSDISRWQDTVRHNRIAEQLQFPMNIPKVPKATSTSMTRDFKPVNELEDAIANVLETGGINEKKIVEFEELATNELTEEEVEERRQQLSKMRSLMLYKEQKHRRQKKIKSKRYRKMLRLAKDKEKLTLEELAVVDPERYQKLLEEQELDRIKERLTLKHSNTSKWAKRAVKQKDLHSRQAIQEQLQKKELLRRKMANIHDSDSESSDEEMDSEQEIDEEFEELQADESSKEKGIHSLMFMKRAAKKEQEAINDLMNDSTNDNSDEEEVVGRMKFGPSSVEAKRNALEKAKAQKPKVRQRNKGKSPLTNFKIDAKPEKVQTESAIKKPDPSVANQKNPWMNLKSDSKVTKQAKELEIEQATSKGTISTELNIDDVISVSEDKLKATNLLSNQKDIVEEAFAGLDVYKEFKEEKEELLNEDDDDTIPTQDLPGWGSWAGEGVKMSKRQKAKLARKKRQKQKELEERKAKRKDAKLNNVIINEEEDKKFSKYQLSQLPYEFGNKRQYERSLAQPLGPEWNTLSSHSKLTKPSIVVRPGLTIDPLENPEEKKKNANKNKRRQRKPISRELKN